MTDTIAPPDPPPAAGDATALLAATATLGGWFAIPTLTDTDTTAGSGGATAVTAAGTGGANVGGPLSALIADPAALVDFTLRTRAAIATASACRPEDIPVRLAASSLQSTVVARLVSPVIGAVLTGGRVPLITADSVRWRDTGAHGPQLHVADVRQVPAPDHAAAAAAIAASLFDTVVLPLTGVLRSAVGLSEQVSRGNAASAANGAVTVLAMSRPDLEAPGRDLVRALLGSELLRGAAVSDGSGMRRRNCCLFYRAPGGSLCPDCVLAAPAA